MWDNVPEIGGLPYQGLLTHDRQNRPRYFRIETVNTCNNLCVICAYRDQTRPRRIMPMEIFRKAVRDYAELGGGFLSLTPLVGDVFMDRHLLERLDYVSGVFEISELGLTTNAAMSHRFDDAELQRIVRGFRRLSISIYGIDAPEYDAMTKRRTYPHMVDGIRRIVEAADHEIVLEFRLLNKRTHDELMTWLALEVLPGLRMAEVEAKIRINSVITDYANWGIYDDTNTPLPSDARWFDFKPVERRHQCMIPMFTCIVFSDGNVSFCACDNFDDTPELRLGNIMEHSLAELYNSPRAAELWDWERYGTPKFCQGCSFHIPTSELKNRPSLVVNPHQIVGSG